jgi:hypothetical protein
MSTRVVAYVDGFNLYHGIHQHSGRRDLWLDIAGMLRRHFVDPSRGQELTAVHYFTAAVNGPGRLSGRRASMAWGNANDVEPGPHLSVRTCPGGRVE